MRYLYKTLIVAIFISLFCHKLYSQDAKQGLIVQHNVGFGAGFATGFGSSYRIMLNDFGLQTNFFILTESHNIQLYSIGFTPLYVINKTERANIYIYQGNHILKERRNDSYIVNGVGIGIELVVLDRIGLNIMGGYASYDLFERMNFTTEMAFYFKF